MADVIIRKDGKSEGEESRYLVRWKSRQKMAWMSFYAILILTITLWFVLPYFYQKFEIPPERWVSNITDSAEWMYITLGSVIIGYMGSTAYMMRGRKIEMNDKDF